MTRDYKARQAPRPRRGRRGTCFFWFVSGTLLGAFGVGLAWMLKNPLTPVPDAPAVQTEVKPVTKPRFDFHNILPEMEVLVPDEELAERPPPPPKPVPEPPPKKDPVATPKPPEQRVAKPAKPAKPASDGVAYLLQVASFRGVSDAERLKARLALLGMQSRIQRVTVNNKDTYHRVRTGPYKGKQAVNQARALLSKNGLESIAIRLK